MTALVHSLLQDPAGNRSAGRLLALSTLASGCFGAAIGSYVGGWQVAYAAVKMPLFFIGTLAVSFAAMHVLAARSLPARGTFVAASETIAVTAVVLAALAPVVALAAISTPRPSPGGYRFLVLLLTASVATGGICGVFRLHARIRSARLTAAWIVIYQFVGAQMAWLLKPWVGHTFTDDRFLPVRDNLRGNFYESVFNTLRHPIF